MIFMLFKKDGVFSHVIFFPIIKNPLDRGYFRYWLHKGTGGVFIQGKIF